MNTKALRRMSMPAYDPIRVPARPKAKLRISHTIEVEGHGTVKQEAEAVMAWRVR